MTLLTRSFFRCRAWLILAAVGLITQTTRGEIPMMVGKMPEDSIPALKAILETAAKQSPTVLARAIQLEQAELDVTGSKAALLPNVGGSYSYAGTTVYPADGDSNKTKGPYYNIGISQPIYQWNALKNQVEISKIGLQITQKNYADAFRGLINNLRSQFLGLIYKKNIIRTQRFNLELTKKYLELDEAKLAAGAMSQVELILPRQNTVQAMLDMARTDEEYDHAKRLFARLAGIESLAEDSIPLEAPKWAGSNELVASLTALLRRDGVDVTLQGQVNSLSLKRAELNYQIAKVRLYPKVSASANASQSNSQTVTDISASQSSARSYSYGIVANWTLFDGFAARSAKLSALAAKRSFQLERTQLEATLTEEIRSLARTIDFTAQSLALTEERRAGAADLVTRTKDEFDRGQMTEPQVDTARAKLYAQDGVVAASRLDLLSRWVELVSLLNADPMLEKLPFTYVH